MIPLATSRSRAVEAGDRPGPGSRAAPVVLAACLGVALLAMTRLLAGPSQGVEEAPGTVASGPDSADRLAIERRLREIEQQIASLRAEVERLRSGAASPGSPAGGPARTEDLEGKIDALSREIERLRIGETAGTEPGNPPTGLGPAASKVYALRKGVSIGGYGQMLYEGFAARRDDGGPSNRTAVADLERAVLYYGYKFNDRFLLNTEVEYEHAVSAPDQAGEVAVEFAYIDFRATKAFGLRGGLLLVPVGFLNELHEPPIFHGALRPDVETDIIPTTWSENGLGFYGAAGPVSYRAYLVTSLRAAGFSAEEGIREARQEGSEALARDLAQTARLDWTPAPGMSLGAAAFTGRVGQGAPGAGHARLTLWDLHAEWIWRGLRLRALFARTILSDAEAIGVVNTFVDPVTMLPVVPAIGSREHGWYGEIAWNLLARVKGVSQELSPFVRFESLDTQDDVAPGFVADPANDRTVRTYGLTYRPIPNIAVKIDYQDVRNGAGTGVDRIGFALGYLF